MPAQIAIAHGLLKVNCSCDLTSGEIGPREALIDMRQYCAHIDVVCIDVPVTRHWTTCTSLPYATWMNGICAVDTYSPHGSAVKEALELATSQQGSHCTATSSTSSTSAIVCTSSLASNGLCNNLQPVLLAVCKIALEVSPVTIIAGMHLSK